MGFLSTKTFGNDRGLSCCFRQWKANHSHCSLLHGYSIGIKLVFDCDTLDDKNWVMDFGGLKKFKEWAEYMFDHTLIVAKDDPQLEAFVNLSKINNQKDLGVELHKSGALCDLRIVDAVGCEMFSKLVFDKMQEILEVAKSSSNATRYPVNPTVRLVSAEVFEHQANSAMYTRD